jgi:phage baseplate assembly protein W
MSSVFDRERIGFRFVEVQQDDSLQLIAFRALGDAARWTELIAYNNLIPPFVTNDATITAAGVLHPGDLIMVPAVTAAAAAAQNVGDDVLLTDAALVNRRLGAANGDFALVSGLANLKQALINALDTDRGDLIFHPQYGSLIRRIIGAVNGPTATLLAAEYAKGPVAADPRILRVTSAVAVADGDAIRVTIEAESALGRQVAVDATL